MYLCMIQISSLFYVSTALVPGSYQHRASWKIISSFFFFDF